MKELNVDKEVIEQFEEIPRTDKNYYHVLLIETKLRGEQLERKIRKVTYDPKSFDLFKRHRNRITQESAVILHDAEMQAELDRRLEAKANKLSAEEEKKAEAARKKAEEEAKKAEEARLKEEEKERKKLEKEIAEKEKKEKAENSKDDKKSSK